MSKKTGIVIAVALAVVAALYLVFANKNSSSGTVTLTGVGTIPTSALTPLDQALPCHTPVPTSIQNAAAAFNSTTPIVPCLFEGSLTSITPGVDGVLSNPDGVVTD